QAGGPDESHSSVWRPGEQRSGEPGQRPPPGRDQGNLVERSFAFGLRGPQGPRARAAGVRRGTTQKGCRMMSQTTIEPALKAALGEIKDAFKEAEHNLKTHLDTQAEEIRTLGGTTKET